MVSNNIFDEVMERLKQKAKSIDDLHEIYHTDYLDSCLDDEPAWFWFWVRLEDVKEAIQQLKQNYVLVEKSKLDDLLRQFPLRPLGIGALEMGSKLEFLIWFKRLKELLKE